MDADVLLLTFRFIERLTNVLLGGFAVYLGFKLFLHLPTHTDSQGKIILPGGVSVYLSRIGPGAFFALFGTVVLVYSLSLKAETDRSANTDSDSTTTISYRDRVVYSIERKGSKVSPEDDLAKVVMDLETLSDAERVAKSTLEGNPDSSFDLELATKLNTAIPRLRSLLVRSQWRREWGDPYIFIEWLEKKRTTIPDDYDAAMIHFRIKQEKK